jgi:hypothetical protein
LGGSFLDLKDTPGKFKANPPRQFGKADHHSKRGAAKVLRLLENLVTQVGVNFR